MPGTKRTAHDRRNKGDASGEVLDPESKTIITSDAVDANGGENDPQNSQDEAFGSIALRRHRDQYELASSIW